MSNNTIEVNFDCLVGPTHNFAGLSFGNLASMNNEKNYSFPQKAALQGLEKMYFLHKKGFKQAILPPHKRPLISVLEQMGFIGEKEEILQKALITQEILLKNIISSSAMWAANSATISPSIDCKDNICHISIANLQHKFHRSIEAFNTYEIFKQIFAHKNFIVHKPLISHDIFSDEGAANHNRLAPSHDYKGLEIFVYGKTASLDTQKTTKYPARQSLLASQSIALRHSLDEDYVLFLEQNPQAIDAGAFHNDVVCVMNENVVLCHEQAFNDHKAIDLIKQHYEKLYDQDAVIISISSLDLSLKDCVQSYLFNSQLLSKPDGKMLLFAPYEACNNQSSKKVIDHILASNNPIDEVYYFDVSESMSNGGGPACLRLRFALTNQEFNSILPTVIFNQERYDNLRNLIEKYYPQEFNLSYLTKPDFLNLCDFIHKEIFKILGLFSF